MFEDNSLNGILGVFSKTKKKLETFISENTQVMDNLQHDLNTRQGEDAQAKKALDQINKIVE